MKRCPYGDDCKFQHVGEGACIDKPKDAPLSKAERDKKKKCFSFKKKGKCVKGDACPFSHDVNPAKQDDGDDGNAKQAKSASEKDCINWKKKGKCRKLNSKGGCPYPTTRKFVLRPWPRRLIGAPTTSANLAMADRVVAKKSSSLFGSECLG